MPSPDYIQGEFDGDFYGILISHQYLEKLVLIEEMNAGLANPIIFCSNNHHGNQLALEIKIGYCHARGFGFVKQFLTEKNVCCIDKLKITLLV